MPRIGRIGACLGLALLAGCGGGGGGAPDPRAGDAGCRLGELSEAQMLAVTRQPAELPLAEASYYQPRQAPRAADARLNAGACSRNTRFRYGAGLGDITGPAADQGTATSADPQQISNGIHTRQYARAFAIESSCDGRSGRVMIVNIEAGLVFQSVRQGVLDALRADPLGELYNERNLLITATHTHATVSGQSHHDLYNLPTLGFDPQSYAAMVEGIVSAIRRANGSLRRGNAGPILLAQGEVLNGNVNRSPDAYALNPEDERRRFVDRGGREVQTNRMMTLLKFLRDDGQAVGMMNWYAVHNTSMAQTTRLQSSDNKGYAARRFERDFGRRYLDAEGADEGFVAAFQQEALGDVSPNLFGIDLSDAEGRDHHGEAFRQRGGGRDDYQSAMISGHKQYAVARELYREAAEPLRGEVGSAFVYLDFSRMRVEQPRAYPPALQPADGQYRTCQPAYGIGALGATGGDGGATAPLSSGTTCATVDEPSLPALRDRLFGALAAGEIPTALWAPVGCHNPALDALGYDCQAEKPIVGPLAFSPVDTQAPDTGLANQGMVPSVLPVQILTLGNLAIVALPWEVTTLSGRRLHDAVLAQLADAGVDYAVIESHSNSYVQYLATREEYALQRYAGASTLFGPWNEEAVRQEVARLARSLRNGQAPDSPYRVADYRSHVTAFVHTPVFSDGIATQPFGTVVQQPEDRYAMGPEELLIRARFIAGHPRHDLRHGASFLYIERKLGASWQTVASDDDWSTRYTYLQDSPDGAHHALVEWRPPAGTPPGRYRVRHEGVSAQGPYAGVTREFELQGCR